MPRVPEFDEALVAQEVVRFAARSDVNEELSRLRGHLAHWSVLAASSSRTLFVKVTTSPMSTDPDTAEVLATIVGSC